ncbi:hypothetical protein [Rippkaea orientalis]|uniref:hypothetical protein n=1 Tax=Rippkaea orientalis TaxID=2546366 RepID=UPI0001723D56|nr:hypothetical protein [Rippkaea orientalis]
MIWAARAISACAQRREDVTKGLSLTNPLETALSLAGVTEYLQLLLEDDPQLNQLWVTGEVSSLT